MEEKWICSKCGQENDDLFCIHCGSRRPEKTEAVEPAETAAAEAAATEEAVKEAAPEKAAESAPAETPAKEAAPVNTEPKPAKKSALLKIIIAAAVLVAAIIAVLFLFVFNKKGNTYQNEFGNYSIAVPKGYKTTDHDNGFLAEGKDAVFFVDFLMTDYRNALVYRWVDLVEFNDRVPYQLQNDLGIEGSELRILDPETYGDNDTHSYSLTAVDKDGLPVEGEVHMIESRKFGQYLICYYRKSDLDEKKAEKVAEDFQQFLDSFDSDRVPNIPYYELTDLTEMFLGDIAIRSELVGDITTGGKMCKISDPDNKEQVIIEIIFAKSVAEVFSWEGITDGQIESASTEKITDKGRYTYDTYVAEYRDKKNNKRAYGIYGIFADNKQSAIIAIEYDVSADMKEWAEDVVADIMWSWNIHD